MEDIIQTPLTKGGPMFLPNADNQPITLYQLVVKPSSRTLWIRVTDGDDWTEVPLF